jgi:hypothetical protein
MHLVSSFVKVELCNSRERDICLPPDNPAKSQAETIAHRARLIERRRRAAPALTRLAARIEAAEPLPFLERAGVADRPADSPDMDVAKVDLPGLLWSVGIAAAGKVGHGFWALEERPETDRGAIKTHRDWFGSSFGFESEHDALDWIREKSQAWLLEHR